MFKLRIVEADYYLSKPTELDRIITAHSNYILVPIIRIFGTTRSGKKCCLHLHNYFPYVSIRWDNETDSQTLDKFVKEIEANLSQTLTRKNSKPYVYNIEIIKTKSIYGYQEKNLTFIKIFLYNPHHVKSLNELFLKGIIFSRLFQPYQSHVPYVLQMFIDFSLFGMNFIYLTDFRIRNNYHPDFHKNNFIEDFNPSFIQLNEASSAHDLRSMKDIMLSNIPSQTYCEIEIDADIYSIKNKDVYKKLGYTSYPGIDDLINDDIALRKVYNMEDPPSFGHPKRTNYLMLPSEKKIIDKIDKALNNIHMNIQSLKSTSIIDAQANNKNITLTDYDMDDLEYNLSIHGSDKMDDFLNLNDSDEDYSINSDDLSNVLKGKHARDNIPQNQIGDNFSEGEALYQIDGRFDNPKKQSGKESRLRNRENLLSLKTYYPPLTKLRRSPRKGPTNESNLKTSRVKYQDSLISSSHNDPRDPLVGTILNGSTGSSQISSCISCTSRKEVIPKDRDKTLKKSPRHDIKIRKPRNVPQNRLLTSTLPIVKKSKMKDFSRGSRYSIKYRNKSNCTTSIETKVKTLKNLERDKVSDTTDLLLESQDESFNVTIVGPGKKVTKTDILGKNISLKPLSDPMICTDNEKPVFKYEMDDEANYPKPSSTYPGTVYPIFETNDIDRLKDFHTVPEGNVTDATSLSKWKSYLNTLPTVPSTDSARTRHQMGPICIKPAIMSPTLFSGQETNTEDLDPSMKLPQHKNITTLLHKDASFCNLQGLQMRPVAPSLPSKKDGGVINLQRAQNLTTISCEVYVKTRADLTPNPLFDSVQAIFFTIYQDRNNEPLPGDRNIFDDGLTNGFCAVCDDSAEGSKFGDAKWLAATLNVSRDLTFLATSEVELFRTFQKNVVIGHDPDILIGFEIEKSSWGYLCSRARYLGLVANGKDYLSRLRPFSDHHHPRHQDFNVQNDPSKPAPPNGGANYGGPFSDMRNDLEISIPGRILFNGWRLVRKQMANNNYTFENVYYRLLGLRTAKYTFKTLNTWYQDPIRRWRVFSYYFIRTRGIHSMLGKMDTIDQTSEFARLYGVELHNVIHRGSQYKVESMMHRLAYDMGYIPVSPSPTQRNRMSMSQMMPLVMEPEAGLYTDPVIVLDFQSLYPSIVIAYNYCYSTCLGYLKNWAPHNRPFKFGCTELSIDVDVIKKLKTSIHVSPVDVGFVNKDVRLGVLPSMLYKILNARVRVKNSMKFLKKAGVLEPYLEKLLDARQLALKMIANVTFGYTSAYFSGRMPCVEIADSILSKVDIDDRIDIIRQGREILQKAIDYIGSRKGINARVIYGDTDSIFVVLKDHSRREAFVIGESLAKEISQLYVQPIELKFEKVYQPCILQSKKRYVGFSYESNEQTKPKYDAKGIETVRRDFCAAVPKVLECVITELFRSGNVDAVRIYLEKQFRNIMDGKISLQDFIIAKEYRGRTGYKPRACVPALEIAKRLVRSDPMTEPLIKERVSYVIITPEHTGNLKPYQNAIPLISLVRTPYEFMQMRNVRLNGTYYITKQLIPPINRIMKLIGIDIFKWYEDIPRNFHLSRFEFLDGLGKDGTQKAHGTITKYFDSIHCFICRTKTCKPLCDQCSANSAKTTYYITKLIQKWSWKYGAINEICKSCTSISDPTNKCISLDCPVFYHLIDSTKKMSKVPVLTDMQSNILDAW